jgi:DNA mismatch endonuclease (patch repair protein)
MKHPKHYDTDEATSKRMSHVRLRGGKAETALEKALWHKGYRYWKNYKKLPGSPDIALQKYHVAIFVDGEFWHGKNWPTRKEKLKRNRNYWIQKIEENMRRDKKVDFELRELGWMPVHFWDSEIKKNINECIKEIDTLVESNEKEV